MTPPPCAPWSLLKRLKPSIIVMIICLTLVFPIIFYEVRWAMVWFQLFISIALSTPVPSAAKFSSAHYLHIYRGLLAEWDLGLSPMPHHPLSVCPNHLSLLILSSAFISYLHFPSPYWKSFLSIWSQPYTWGPRVTWRLTRNVSSLKKRTFWIIKNHCFNSWHICNYKLHAWLSLAWRLTNELVVKL